MVFRSGLCAGQSSSSTSNSRTSPFHDETGKSLPQTFAMKLKAHNFMRYHCTVKHFTLFPQAELKSHEEKKIQKEKRENCPCTFGPVNKACNRRAAQLKMVTDEWITGNGCY